MVFEFEGRNDRLSSVFLVFEKILSEHFLGLAGFLNSFLDFCGYMILGLIDETSHNTKVRNISESKKK